MARRVLEPLTLGSLQLRNRLVMAPVTTQYADERGRVTEQLKAHYETRARGGAGLIIVEASYVLPVGQAFKDQLGIYDDSLIPGLRQLAAAIKRQGCVAAIQLHHAGRMAKSGLSGLQPVAPSAIADPRGEQPRALDASAIRSTVRSFAEAAARAKEAGFDGVEIHGAHAYLIDQFISPSANRRTDAYGGPLENRARFMLEVVAAAREAVGADYPVWLRMNGREYGVEGGTTLEDALEVARLAERAGAAAIHVSAYGPATPTNRTTAGFQPAVIADLAAAMKHAVSIPVMAVGRITPEAAEDLLESGAADLVALGKALLADPDLPGKLVEGRDEEIVPCIVCMHCRDSLMLAAPGGIRCQVNPRLGCDHEPAAVAAPVSKKVLIVGGGPAGMVAALTAARRGHSVTLWERGRALGGQLLQAAVPPHKDRIGCYTRFLARELGRSGVVVELQREATVEEVLGARPDAVVVATGARPLSPDIPGLKRAGAVEAGAVLDGSV
ncbi:MAG: FAD-dependent oxidoreductase, partial [Dehalococcoidia bacterium]|nr:FAD-dependent oxidoreductase [Dehalococcoidia bacterium]